MANLIAVLFLGLACASAVMGMNFKLTDCEPDKAHEWLTVSNAHISPYPIPIPGTVHVTGSLNLKHNITSGMTVELSVQRKFGFIWIPVPCTHNVGSCSYHNVCGMLKSMAGHCPSEVTDMGLPCGCPIQSGTYSLSNMQFQIPKLSGVLAFLAKGDYRVTAKVKQDNGHEVACQHVEATLGQKCHGFLCSIIG